MTMGHRLRSGSARRGLASLSAAALLTSILAVPAFAEHYENTEVLEAEDAIGAALAWSETTFESAETVIIGRDDVFADNLASGVLQGTDSPLLLTDTDELAAEVADEIERLGADSAYVLGGDSAISEDVVGELEDLGLDVERLAGETRIETAIAVAEEAAPDGDSAILARAFGGSADESQAFADSLAAGAWAAESGMPVLLTQTAELNDNLAAYLDGDGSSIESITIVGGTSAVSAAVASELEAMGIEVDRVSGATRFETAIAIAEARGYADSGDAEEVILTEGQASDAWASGFAAAAYSAINGAPIVLSNGDDLPEPTQEWLEGGAPAASLQDHGTAHLVCGPMVDAEACAAAAEALGNEPATHGPATFTEAPELTGASFVRDDTTNNLRLIRYTFDEEVTSVVIASLFRVYPPNTNNFVTGTSAQRDPDDTSAVLVSFALNNNTREATAATVRPGAVQDASGTQNPEGDADLAALSRAAGATSRPDLTSVTNVNATNNTVDFTFDDAVTACDATDYRLIFNTAASAPLTGASCLVVPDTSSRVVRVTFADFTDVQAADARRGAALSGAATGANGDNPQQTEPVTGTSGQTNTPDLVSVTLDATNHRATFTFDETVDTVQNRAGFRLYYADGTEIVSTVATDRAGTPTQTSNQVVAQFQAGAVNASVAGASVDQGAVRSDVDNARVGRTDEVGVAQNFAAGDTLGPELVSVLREPQRDIFGTQTGVQITYTFDTPVATSAGNFVVYNAAGVRTILTGCARLGTATDTVTKVRCSGGTGTTQANAITSAALGAVEYNAVVNRDVVRTGATPGTEAGTANVNYPNTEDSAGVS